MVFALLALHAALAALAPPLARHMGRRVLLLAGVPPALTVAWGAVAARRILGGESWTEKLSFAPSLGFEPALRIDPFGLLMLWIVSGIGVLVFVYAFSYYSKPRDDLGRFASALSAFSGSMLGLVVSDNLLGLFFFWEATSISSYMLIGFNDKSEEARAAALQALVITGLGGLAMLAGFVIVGQASGTYSISEILAAPPASGLVEAGLVCILLGAFTKSAQVPFHSWLPSAMVAPTPVSAYLHSATMVKAGVFLIARLSPAFGTSAVWRPLCVSVGATTMLVGAYRALRQFDLKLLLAYGTVSKLGLMVVLFGLGDARAAFAGVAVLVAHVIYKAALFMSAGVVERSAGTRDMRRLDGLGRAMPGLFAATALAAASMAGIPPLLGFVAKEEAFSALLEPGRPAAGPATIVVVVVASSLTVAYAARFLRGAFASRTGSELAVWESPAPERSIPTRTGWLFSAPTVLLATVGVGAGAYPRLLGWIVDPAAAVLYPADSTGRLMLWHGLGLPVALSGIALLGGIALFFLGPSVERAQRWVPRTPGSLEGYRAALGALLKGASRTTGIVQCGSLPVYLAVIAVTLLAMPGVAVGIALLRSGEIYLGDPPKALPTLLTAAVIATAFAIAKAKHRFSAVLMLGGVGYGVGVFFVIQGAPDLALTQFLVETLMVIIFVLVLRHLPPEFPPTRVRGYTLLRLALASLVGVFAFAFATLSIGARELPAISGEYLVRALPEAYSKNVVNSILVDFRALDTMGEITVIAVAAIGISALVLASRERVRGSTTDPERHPR